MMKILIVEDDKDIVTVISEELKQWGYETCSIHDFNAVLEEFREQTPQLILMDITLPYFNGYYITIFQWILLDPKDSRRVERADYFYIIT